MSGCKEGEIAVARREKAAWRVTVVGAIATVLMGLIGSAFWYWDLRYSRPTPRPADLVQVPLGTHLPVTAWLERARLDAGERPVHLHFFNPACPCSRFNLDHLHTLIRTFGAKVFFVAVVQSDLADVDSPEGRRELESILGDLGIPWTTDPEGTMAAAAGVYSTPQAVIVTADGALHYRGNYNTSRYCTDPRTEFARLALASLMSEQRLVAAPASEMPAYGCELPSETARPKGGGKLSLQETNR